MFVCSCVFVRGRVHATVTNRDFGVDKSREKTVFPSHFFGPFVFNDRGPIVENVIFLHILLSALPIC